MALKFPNPFLFYTCGPTVYGPAHIGNLRTFVISDLVRRAAEFSGVKVTSVMNITDVDDKTITGARAAGRPLGDFTHEHEANFLQDLDTLNIKKPTHLPRATAYIPTMVKMIEELLACGAAYRAEDGIYFRVGTFPDYGKLAGFSPATVSQQQSRIKADSYDKEEARDFALWKFYIPEDGEVFWETSLGKGRPGWHIECSAMIRELLGETIDLHVGGIDLIFPHHTNEIAQTESLTGQPLARHWLHVAFVNVDGQKMSKSLGNIITLAEIKNKNYSALTYRYWLLTAHYRTTVNFTWEALTAAQTAYQKLKKQVQSWPVGEFVPDQKYLIEFQTRLEDDLNLPQAVALVWKLVDDNSIFSAVKLATVLKFDEVLGLNLAEAPAPITTPPEVQKLVDEREGARQTSNWPEADRLRVEITKLGWQVEDTPEGPKLSST